MFGWIFGPVRFWGSQKCLANPEPSGNGDGGHPNIYPELPHRVVPVFFRKERPGHSSRKSKISTDGLPHS